MSCSSTASRPSGGPESFLPFVLFLLTPLVGYSQPSSVESPEAVLAAYLDADSKATTLFEFCDGTRRYVMETPGEERCVPRDVAFLVDSTLTKTRCAQASKSVISCEVSYSVVALGQLRGPEEPWVRLSQLSKKTKTEKVTLIQANGSWVLGTPYILPHPDVATYKQRLVSLKNNPAYSYMRDELVLAIAFLSKVKAGN